MGKKTGIICWHSKATGYESEGEPIDYEEAVKLAEEMDNEYPELAHWVREVNEEKA